MTTLYRVLVLSLLLYIVALLLGKQAVTSVAPSNPEQEAYSDLLKSVDHNLKDMSKLRRNDRLAVKEEIS